jgi:hypothetical protein
VAGVFGSGKSSVAAEIADVLEKRDAPFAFLDLDFLAWGYAGSHEEAEQRLLLKNLTAVVGNYVDVGVRYFVLAGFIRNAWELESLRRELGMPLRVVRLSVPWPEIERRLRSDVTTGRQDDLRRAAHQVEASEGVGIEDLAVSNDGPIDQVAAEILDWLGWP